MSYVEIRTLSAIQTIELRWQNEMRSWKDTGRRETIAQCAMRNVDTLLDSLEAVAERSQPVIAMSFEACDGAFRSKKYLNYSQSVGANLRGPARPVDHADRASVGARLFASYDQHIAYAALSPDGRGLSSYGEVMVSWRVTMDYLGKRMSLLEENSYVFHERHGLGRLGSAPPRGLFLDVG